MSNETKWDVFEEALSPYKDGDVWHKKYLANLRARYDAALPDDLPVIPETVGEYITSCKAMMMDLHDSMFNWLRSEEEDEFMNCYSEIFASAWVLGVWRVEETGEIVKLEAKK